MSTSDTADLNADAIAGLGGGTASLLDVQREIDAAWRRVTADPATRSEIADILGVDAEKVTPSSDPPVKADSAGAGAGGLDIAIVVLVWFGSEILLGAVKDIVKDEVKKRVRQLWERVILPAIKENLSRDELGTQSTLEK
jgi:hypothetical protein